MKFVYFRRKNCSSATAKNFYMSAACLLQQIIHVFEKFHVTALVRSDGNCLRVFLDGAVNNLFHAAVMSKVNYLCTACLNNSAHDVDSGIVPVKQRSGSNYTEFVLWFVNFCFNHRKQI